MKNSIFIFLISIFLFKCKTPLVKETKEFSSAEWKFSDSLSINYNNSDTLSLKKIRLRLSLNDDYNYSNIYLKFRVIDPKNKETTTLPEFELSDLQGNWHVGKSWFSNTYEFASIINEKAKFNLTGNYKFVIAQYMREDALKGVEKFSFEIE